VARVNPLTQRSAKQKDAGNHSLKKQQEFEKSSYMELEMKAQKPRFLSLSYSLSFRAFPNLSETCP